MKKFSKFPNVIELSGKPYERGHTYGSKCKKLIKKYLDIWFSWLSSVQPPDISLTKEQALNLSSKYLPYATDYAPELIEECRGIGDGANIDYAEIFFLNCSLDILDFIFASLRWKYSTRGSSMKTWLPRFGCTTFMASGKATKSNSDVIMGQTFDMIRGEGLQESAVLLKIRPEKGPTSIHYSIAGVVGFNGLNSSGIGIVYNKIVTNDSGPGVPQPFIVRKALQQKRIGDAVDSILNCKRASGSNHIVGDKNGEIFNVECTATAHEVLIPLNSIVGHSNHIVSECLKPFSIYAPDYTNSLVRWSRINKYLNDEKGKITVEGCKEWLKDHVNYPLSLCSHEEPPSEIKTMSGMIMLPKELKILATYGNPCTQPYIEYWVPK